MSKTSTILRTRTLDEVREMLTERVEINDADIPELIGRAAELQDEADRPTDPGRSTRDQVKAIAAELDLDESYVNQAIEEYLVNRPPDAQALKLARVRRSAVMWFRISVASFVFLSIFSVVPIVLASNAKQAVREGDVQDAEKKLLWTKLSMVGMAGALACLYTFIMLVGAMM